MITLLYSPLKLRGDEGGLQTQPLFFTPSIQVRIHPVIQPVFF
jgi:hypothetical protein